jgi:tetratricopeptide (TPR) repeat protein
LGIARKRNWKDEESYALTSIGIAYYNLKEYQKSIEFHQKSLAIDTELKNRSRVAMALRNIGLAYQVQRNFSRAFQLFEQSLAVRRELKDSAKVIDLLEAMAQPSIEWVSFITTLARPPTKPKPSVRPC